MILILRCQIRDGVINKNDIFDSCLANVPPLPDSMRKLKSLAAVVFPSEGRKQAYGFLRGFTE
jgi:hypothetical protein